MKESISYSFLLNIIILFIFVCVAIVMGIFSYYRAFRANTIIVNAIEKYEGYNCFSAEEAALKLDSIGYKVPFEVKCKGDYVGGVACKEGKGNTDYYVLSYNIDEDNLYEEIFLDKEDSEVITGGTFSDYADADANAEYSGFNVPKRMNSYYKCSKEDLSCQTTKVYQYGVYTYMYVDLPVISNFIKIPYFSKTKKLYEFRNYAGATKIKKSGKTGYFAYDVNNVPKSVFEQYDVMVSLKAEDVKDDIYLSDLLSAFNENGYDIGYYGLYRLLVDSTSEESITATVNAYNSAGLKEEAKEYEESVRKMSLFDNSARSAMQYRILQNSLRSGDAVLTDAKDNSCGTFFDYNF